MTRERDPYGWALSSVRRKLKAGAYAGGDQLTIVDLAKELSLSPTPVREALAHLAGEGLIEDRRGRGYYAWRLDAPELAELYDLHALIVGAALNSVASVDWTMLGPVTGSCDPAKPVLQSLVQVTGSRTLIAVFGAVDVRLGPARTAEAQVLGDLSDEVARLAQAFEARRWPALGEAIETYHDRRRRRVTDIAAALHKRSQACQRIYQI